MEKWFIRNNGIDFRKIAKELDINPIISKILVNREIYEQNSIDRFLNIKLDKLYSPSLMKDLVKAGNILRDKVDNNKKIRIVGDFDVDGVISVYILNRAIERLGGIVDYAIPDRINDGYGINNDIVERAKADGVDTIITCDNGIAALEQVRLAKKLGLNIIVTDHHDLPFIQQDNEKKYLYPVADAVVNPKRPDCEYPFKSLCGAGVAFKLIDYLYSLYDIPREEVYGFMEYVAIATICDVVDLVDENRIIVKHGLELINSTKNIGLKALMRESKLNREIGVYHIGFVIGPTINASGRLDSAYLALELLLCGDEEKAIDLAKKLRELNEERKALTEDGIESIINKIESSSLKDDKVLVIYEPHIHESVAGIIAGRVKDNYNKPTIVLTEGIEGIKGSGRSIEEYNIFEELTKCKDILNRFGGHPMAAGLSLDLKNIQLLRERLNSQTNLTDDDLIRKVYIDMGLPIEYISYELIEELETLQPFGKGNSRPIFGAKSLKIVRMFKLGVNENVLKFTLESKKGSTMEGILFNNTLSFEEAIISKYGENGLDELYRGINNDISIDIIYYPSINEYMGKISIQIVIQHFRI
ncbi:MAG: single-stranded-DNA-specific exonuclease RecJ [Tissierellaceae bacterium]